jgi:predicted transcriptional regulator
MADSAALTVRLPTRTKEQLAELAALTRRTSSFLAAEAIAGYVAREMAIVAAIERRREDARAGRVMSHDAVMREARAVIEEARMKP